jgi:hypothetical protein
MIGDRLRALNERHNPLVRRRWGSYRDPLAIVHDHFAQRSSLEHVNYTSMRDTIALLGGRPQVILETGSSAWGTDSTRLWDAYVRSFGGELWSVDLREEPRERLRGLVGRQTTLVCADSVAFLRGWVADHAGVHAGLVYLDSYDVDFADPLPAAEHCVAEVAAVLPALGPGSLVLVDDSPGSRDDLPEEWREAGDAVFERLGLWPGKGMLVDRWLAEQQVAHEKVHHRYQVLYRF